MRNRPLLSIAFVLALIVVLQTGSTRSIAHAQATSYGYSDRPYLDRGWHAIAELTERGIVTARDEWESNYVARFVYRGCGFAMQYTIVTDTTELVSVYVDGTLAESFDGVGEISDKSTRWYNTTCDVHTVLIGTRSIAYFWVTGIDVWE